MRSKTTSHRVFLTSCLLLVAAGCGPETVSPDWHRVDPPLEAPPFTLPTLDGGSMSLSDARGRVAIVEFWATWCGPCRSSLPSLEVIYKRYRDRGATVLLLNEGESAEAVNQWTERRFTAPILLDQTEAVGRQYGVEGLPRLFMLDRDGRIIYEHAGYGGGLEQNLSLILDQLLSPKEGKKVNGHG